MVSPQSPAIELAEAIDATILAGADAVALGPSDAALVIEALRVLAALPLDARRRALASRESEWAAPDDPRRPGRLVGN